jgi:toxin CcdB
MARFDVYEGAGSYLLDCQANVLRHFDTRLVVPLLPASGVPKADRLNPLFEVAGRKVVMATQLAAAIPARELDKPIGTLSDEHSTITNAFDMLLTGY